MNEQRKNPFRRPQSPDERRPGLRQLPKDFDDLATGKTERLRRPRKAPSPLRDEREGAVIAGVRNMEARAVYDARVRVLRQHLAEGRQAELLAGLEAVRKLRLWRARNVTDFRAFVESVIGLSPEQAQPINFEDERDSASAVPDYVVALALRLEAALLAQAKGASVELRAADSGELRVVLELPAGDIHRAVEALEEAGQAASSLRYFLRDEERPRDFSRWDSRAADSGERRWDSRDAQSSERRFGRDTRDADSGEGRWSREGRDAGRAEARAHFASADVDGEGSDQVGADDAGHLAIEARRSPSESDREALRGRDTGSARHSEVGDSTTGDADADDLDDGPIDDHGAERRARDDSDDADVDERSADDRGTARRERDESDDANVDERGADERGDDQLNDRDAERRERDADDDSDDADVDDRGADDRLDDDDDDDRGADSDDGGEDLDVLDDDADDQGDEDDDLAAAGGENTAQAAAAVSGSHAVAGQAPVDAGARRLERRPREDRAEGEARGFGRDREPGGFDARGPREQEQGRADARGFDARGPREQEQGRGDARGFDARGPRDRDAGANRFGRERGSFDSRGDDRGARGFARGRDQTGGDARGARDFGRGREQGSFDKRGADRGARGFGRGREQGSFDSRGDDRGARGFGQGRDQAGFNSRGPRDRETGPKRFGQGSFDKRGDDRGARDFGRGRDQGGFDSRGPRDREAGPKRFGAGSDDRGARGFGRDQGGFDKRGDDRNAGSRFGRGQGGFDKRDDRDAGSRGFGRGREQGSFDKRGDDRSAGSRGFARGRDDDRNAGFGRGREQGSFDKRSADDQARGPKRFGGGNDRFASKDDRGPKRFGNSPQGRPPKKRW